MMRARYATPLVRWFAGRGQDSERGSTLILTLFYTVLALALVLVVMSASSLYLERKRLFTLADGAALAAAEAWELDDVTLDGDALRLELDDDHVAAEASDYLDDATQGGGPADLQIVDASSDDTQSATVTLRSRWYAPISTEFVPISVTIEVTATARSVFH